MCFSCPDPTSIIHGQSAQEAWEPVVVYPLISLMQPSPYPAPVLVRKARGRRGAQSIHLRLVPTEDHSTGQSVSPPEVLCPG
ncbi:unnamed protein product [Knipowitschia caucasica]|uniref:Uncharacterized protein n=1 Tax=Knipowitschia caucasica TaxID=637954 RepID=A0AAV2LBD9_KNICA